MAKPQMIGTMFPKFTAVFFTEDSKGNRNVLASCNDFPNPIYNKCLEISEANPGKVVKLAAWRVELAQENIASKLKVKGICTVAEYIKYRETRYRG